MEPTKLVISLLLLVLMVESRKHHHRRQHNLYSLNGERKQNVFLAPVPETGYFKYNANKGSMLDVNRPLAVNKVVHNFTKVNALHVFFISITLISIYRLRFADF